MPGRLPSQPGLSDRSQIRHANSQPINLPFMREFEDEFINHPINANSPANQLQFRIIRIVEDEVVAVEGC